MNRRILWTVVLLAAALAFALAEHRLENRLEQAPAATATAPSAASRDDVARAESARAHGREVEGRGVVTRLLPDDQSGSRHQRFLVRTAGGPTVLIAHNIDLAQRIDAREGDTVSFRGEYEWNDKGGVVHWTHRDPQGRHERGWIEHNGRVVD